MWERTPENVKRDLELLLRILSNTNSNLRCSWGRVTTIRCFLQRTVTTWLPLRKGIGLSITCKWSSIRCSVATVTKRME